MRFDFLEDEDDPVDSEAILDGEHGHCACSTVADDSSSTEFCCLVVTYTSLRPQFSVRIAGRLSSIPTIPLGTSSVFVLLEFHSCQSQSLKKLEGQRNGNSKTVATENRLSGRRKLGE